MSPEFEEEFEEELKKVAASSYDKMQHSRIFVTLFTKNMITDPVPVLQLGMAIMMNKPIAVLALDGVEVPEALSSRAFAVKRVSGNDREGMYSAMQEILKAADEAKIK